MKHDRITIEDINIHEFIFHIEHHGGNRPILMNSTPIGAFDVISLKNSGNF
jgi:hypothetical protein